MIIVVVLHVQNQFYNFTIYSIQIMIYTNESFGTYSLDIVNLLSKHLNVNIFENSNIDELRNVINEGYPIITYIQAYKEDNETYNSSINCGHWISIIGIYEDYIILNDSGTEDYYKKISFVDFENRWHDYYEDDNTYKQNYFFQIKGLIRNIDNLLEME